ncbi:zinc ribbon domain-containing protein [Candidatus Izimaplasma bacterium]|nr:zinc ribbon domain-containing protein [Candidatus Izimaplasma bacterium]
MKKQKSIYMFAVLIALFIMSGAGLFVTFALGMQYTIIASIIMVVIIVFLIFAANYLSTGQLEQKLTTTTLCNKCNKEIKAGAKYCEHCGLDQDFDVMCEFCGHKNAFDADSCTNCNANLK